MEEAGELFALYGNRNEPELRMLGDRSTSAMNFAGGSVFNGDGRGRRPEIRDVGEGVECDALLIFRADI